MCLWSSLPPGFSLSSGEPQTILSPLWSTLMTLMWLRWNPAFMKCFVCGGREGGMSRGRAGGESHHSEGLLENGDAILLPSQKLAEPQGHGIPGLWVAAQETVEAGGVDLGDEGVDPQHLSCSGASIDEEIVLDLKTKLAIWQSDFRKNCTSEVDRVSCKVCNRGVRDESRTRDEGNLSQRQQSAWVGCRCKDTLLPIQRNLFRTR
jgi:hypothetical protein